MTFISFVQYSSYDCYQLLFFIRKEIIYTMIMMMMISGNYKKECSLIDGPKHFPLSDNLISSGAYQIFLCFSCWSPIMLSCILTLLFYHCKTRCTICLQRLFDLGESKLEEAGENCIIRSFFNVNLTLNIIREIRSGKMRWLGHEAGMEESRNACTILVF